MKLRLGFVSNSSASSFIYYLDRKIEKTVDDFMKTFFPGMSKGDLIGLEKENRFSVRHMAEYLVKYATVCHTIEEAEEAFCIYADEWISDECKEKLRSKVVKAIEEDKTVVFVTVGDFDYEGAVLIYEYKWPGQPGNNYDILYTPEWSC